MAKKLSKQDLVFEIHKASPFTSEKKLMQMDEESLRVLYKWTTKKTPVKVLKEEDALYDSKGNKVVAEDTEDEDEVVEPYNPSYLDEDRSNPYEIPAWEKKFFRKVSILENKMRRAGIKYEWLENWSCFRIERYINSDYPTYRYMRANMDTNDYSFGTEKEDLVFDGKVSVVVEAAVKWLNSNLKKK